MELDELQQTWNELGKQSTTTPSMSPDPSSPTFRSRFRSGLYRIVLPEISGTIVCLLSIGYILLHFDRLDSVAFQCTGILTILLLMAMSLLSL
ncbi:MAG: hypothetical protein KGO92_15640, partial [Bacteroidota bacterium]|nr:hypothetical protein [Bacteroidota bacterium]